MSPQKYKIVIAYEGTAYAGWQIQPNALSIQEIFQTILHQITKEPINVVASGRTDSGVHAKNQVAHFTLPHPLPEASLLKSLNALLPPDIRVKSVEKALPCFHARFSAKGKLYSYSLTTTPVQPPFSRHTSLHFPYPLDLALIEEAIPLLLGTKNFRGFASSGDLEEAECVKTLYKIWIEKGPFGLQFFFHGSGFLHKMVRNLVGTLLEIGQGKMPPSQIEKILATQDRRLAGVCAPPHALSLETVFYS